MPLPHPIVFYDGSCGLCNRIVRFIIRHDRQGRFHFAPLQSEAGIRAIAAVTEWMTPAPDTLILFEEGSYYIQSEAVWRIAAGLDAPWNGFRLLRFMPRFIRESAYRVIAKNRRHWFGETDHCEVLDAAMRSRFPD